MTTSTLHYTEVPQIVAVRDLPVAVTGMIQEQITRLRRDYRNILNCQVNAIVPAFCEAGSYQIEIVLTLADRDVKIDREPTPDYYQEDIYVSIWSAFDLVRKKLREHSHR
jgi:ribosome-associated translation inhibitor RaiA